MVNYDAACLYTGRLFLEYSNRIEESAKLVETQQKEIETLRAQVESLQKEILLKNHGKL